MVSKAKNKPIRFDIITIFPEIFSSYFHEGMMRKGIEKQLIDIRVHNLRDFTKDKWGKVDDIPYGGGAGMVMTPQPIVDAVKAIRKENSGPVIYCSAKGEMLTHTRAKRLSKTLHGDHGLILICGRYEGIDQRAIDLCVDQEICIGKYVLTGGELAVMVLIDVVSRFIPDLLGDENSHVEETFSRKLKGKKEYPHYTKPRNYEGLEVPEVLLSGHHKNIAKWREEHLT